MKSARTRRQFTPAFKAKVALEALTGERTISELATQHKIHPNQITQWRKQLVEQASSAFAHGHGNGDVDHEALINELYQQIGRMSVELRWLKKRV